MIDDYLISYSKRINRTMPRNYVKTIIACGRDFDVYTVDKTEYYLQWSRDDINNSHLYCGDYANVLKNCITMGEKLNNDI